MKKELQKEFEALVRGQMEEFYTNAFSVAGDREAAECLTQESLIWAAKKFAGLASKARVCDLIGERIGKGERGSYEPTDTDAIFLRAMEKLRAKEKRKNRMLGVGAALLAMAVLAVAIPKIPFDETGPTEVATTETETDAEGKAILPVIGEVSMDKTYVIEGDDDVITLVNYHNLSSTLGKKTYAVSSVMDTNTKLERYAATATAPDGTAYLAFTDILNTDQNNPLTLYRMEKDGWKAIASCEVQAYSGYNVTMKNLYSSSRIYLETDEDSNVYLFFLWENAITVCRYDARTGEFTRSAEKIETEYHPMAQYTFSTYYDASVGEKGAVYVGYVDAWKTSFAYYDMAEDRFVYLTQRVGDSASGKKVFCVSDGVIHYVEQSADTGDCMTYYRVEADGTVLERPLAQPDGIWHSEAIANTGSGGGGIETDKNGNVHIIATRHSFDQKIQHRISHYIIDENGEFEQEILPKHCYEDTDGYHVQGVGIFKDDAGDLYYAEAYEPNYAYINLLAVVKLNEKIGEEAALVDAVELPHNITHGFIRIRGKTSVFFTKNYIYYFEWKGIGE